MTSASKARLRPADHNLEKAQEVTRLPRYGIARLVCMKYEDRHTFVQASPNVVTVRILMTYIANRKVFMLGLVGGTDVKGEGRQGFSAGVKDVVAATEPANQAALTEQARKLVLDYEFAGKAVREWIRAPELPTDEPLGSARTYTENMLAFNKLGIMLLRNGLEHGLANDTYGTVVDSKLLVRRIPELKKLGIDLTGLALYY